jgi:Fic family protein
MNYREFENSPAGKVIQVGQGNVAYWAFVPNPLPPNLAPEWELASLLSEADRAVSELAGLGRNLPNPDLFVSPFLRREAVLSSRIEGTQSDLTDLYLYEAGQVPLPGFESIMPPEADLHEVRNYVLALEYGLARLKTLPVSQRLLCEIHERLLAGVRGEYATPGCFRTRQNWIGGRTINDAVYVPPPVDEMRNALDAFEKYLYVDGPHPPLVRLAFLHYQFEALHPFVDGNGRIGRLLLALLLVNWQLLPQPLLYLSAYFERNRPDYYAHLLEVSQHGAWRDWVVFFLRGVKEQANDTIWRIKRLQDLQTLWRGKLDNVRANATTLRLLEWLFAAPVLSIPQAQKLLDVTYHTARRSVEKLAELDILHQFGESDYDRRFIAKEILKTLVAEDGTQGYAEQNSDKL